MNNNYLLTLFISSVLTIGFIFAIYKNIYENKELNCDNYFINTYLYTLLGLSIIPLLYVLFAWSGFIDIMNKFYFSLSALMLIVIFIVQLLLLYGLYYLLSKISPNDTVLIHTVWLFMIMVLTLLFSSSFKLLMDLRIPWMKTILMQALGGFIVIILIGFLLGYYYGDKIKIFKNKSVKSYIFYGLLIISILMPYIIIASGVKNFNTILTIYYGISIVWLIYFLAVFIDNNHLLFKAGKECVANKKVPNYLLESIKLIINLANIFYDLFRVLLLRRLRSSRGGITRRR